MRSIRAVVAYKRYFIKPRALDVVGHVHRAARLSNLIPGRVVATTSGQREGVGQAPPFAPTALRWAALVTCRRLSVCTLVQLTTIAQHRVVLSSAERPTTLRGPRVSDCRYAH